MCPPAPHSHKRSISYNPRYPSREARSSFEAREVLESGEYTFLEGVLCVLRILNNPQNSAVEAVRMASPKPIPVGFWIFSDPGLAGIDLRVTC